MGDLIGCIPFSQLLLGPEEHDQARTRFGGTRRPFKRQIRRNNEIFRKTGDGNPRPAASPNSRLAQNIAAAYYAEPGFFEMKTVQEDGWPGACSLCH